MNGAESKTLTSLLMFICEGEGSSCRGEVRFSSLHRWKQGQPSVTDDETSESQDGLIIILPFIQEQDEATQEVNTTVQEFYCQTEKKSSRSEGSEEDEDEGHGERLPLSIST